MKVRGTKEYLQKVKEVRVPPLMCCHTSIMAAWAHAGSALEEFVVALLQLVSMAPLRGAKEAGRQLITIPIRREPCVGRQLFQGRKPVRG